VRRDVVMVKQPGLLSPNFGATSSHVFTHSPQNVSVEPEIHSLACWDRCFTLPQLLYRWLGPGRNILDAASYNAAWSPATVHMVWRKANLSLSPVIEPLYLGRPDHNSFTNYSILASRISVTVKKVKHSRYRPELA
jgi:hypothetical protein